MRPEFVGSTGQPFEMVVELGKVREFARATLSSNPEYFATREPVSPPTFLQTMWFWAGEEHSPWPGGQRPPFERLLHGEQEFVFPGPPPSAGTHLTGVQRIDKVYTKQGSRGGEMAFTEVVTEFRDDDDVVVAEVRATLIETSKPTSR
jgi:hypothetical protein